jgi:hypothetical protein
MSLVQMSKSGERIETSTSTSSTVIQSVKLHTFDDLGRLTL